MAKPKHTSYKGKQSLSVLFALSHNPYLSGKIENGMKVQRQISTCMSFKTGAINTPLAGALIPPA